MMSYNYVPSFTHKTYSKTKVKPKKMATDFSTITNDVKNLVMAVNKYAEDWGQVGNKISSSDWADYANSVGETSENIAEALSTSGQNLMQDLSALVDTISGFSQKEASQLIDAKTQMSSNLEILNSIGGK